MFNWLWSLTSPGSDILQLEVHSFDLSLFQVERQIHQKECVKFCSYTQSILSEEMVLLGGSGEVEVLREVRREEKERAS